MTIALTIIIIAVAVLLVLIVLAQNSKGGGLSNTFGGGANQLIGVKKTGDAIEKVTWGLAIGVLALSLLFNVLADPGAGGEGEFLTPAQRRAQETAAPAPAQPGIEEEQNETNGIEGSETEPVAPENGGTPNQ